MPNAPRRKRLLAIFNRCSRMALWRSSRLIPGESRPPVIPSPFCVVFPTHRHAGPEFIYMLEGAAIQNGQHLGPGWAGVAESGTLDEQFRSETGCVFLIVYSE